MAGRRRVVIAVPLYRAPELVPDLFDSLIAVADEIRNLPAEILLINDSPDYPPLADALDAHLPQLRDRVDVECLVNASNLGFVRTANRAFAIGIERRADILLLNSDARPRPGAIAEMAKVALLDPMIGFVSPRSNNATLCNSPAPGAWRAGSPDQAYRHHRLIETFLPRYSYVPTAVGFCLYVRREMIEEFGMFDEIYDAGYNEENDLIRRCNRRGYRAVLANHAYVDHLGGASFAASAVTSAQREERNRAILIDRYPEYLLAVRRHYESPDYRAQSLLAGLIPLKSGRLRILFDCRTLTCSHKGSFEHCRHLLAAFAATAADRFDLFVLCERDAFRFHALDSIDGLHFCEQEDVHDRPFAVAMRLVQPFLLADIVALADYAPVTGFLILDTIAMDCQQLDTHGLDILWRFMAETASLIGYNSAFTREQFRRRIDLWPHTTEFLSRCSTDVADYATPVGESETDDNILIVGNDYPHKHVAETVAAIRAKRPDAIVDTLGVTIRTGTEVQPSGLLGTDEVDARYREAGVVVFPSHYEGFGLPILHALARRKTVIARDLPAAREIAERAAGAANLHLVSSTDEIADLAICGPRWQPAASGIGRAEGWTEAAQAMLKAVETALERFDFETCRRQQAAIMGHRARLDAERRFHEGEADNARLQSAVRSSADRLAASEARHEAAEQGLVLWRSQAEEVRRLADAMAAQRAAALHELSRAHSESEHARWAASQELARSWAARQHAKRNEEVFALLLQAPRFDIHLQDITPRDLPASRRRVGTLRDWLTSSRISGRLGDPIPPPSSMPYTCIHLTVSEDHPPIAELSEAVLEWIDLLAVGGRFHLDVPCSSSGNRSDETERDGRALLHALGCSVEGILPRRRSLGFMGVKMWNAAWTPREPVEDALFLRAAYRLFLHREPDREGSVAYLAGMAAGMSHDAVTRSLLTSRERFDRVSAHLAS